MMPNFDSSGTSIPQARSEFLRRTISEIYGLKAEVIGDFLSRKHRRSPERTQLVAELKREPMESVYLKWDRIYRESFGRVAPKQSRGLFSGLWSWIRKVIRVRWI